MTVKIEKKSLVYALVNEEDKAKALADAQEQKEAASKVVQLGRATKSPRIKLVATPTKSKHQ